MKKLDRRHMALLAVSVAVLGYTVLVFAGLGGGSLSYVDGLRTAERSREFLVTGDWSTVHSNFSPSFKKPPLQYWLTALTMSRADDKQSVPRFWSALGAVLAIVATGWLARLVAGGARNGIWAPLLAVLFCGLNLRYSISARLALLDSWMLFFNTGAVVAFLAARSNPRWWWGVAACIALGTWQKAPTALLLVLALCVIQILSGDRKFLRSREFRWAMTLALVCAAAWPIWQWVLHGNAFVERYLIIEMVKRTGFVIAREQRFYPGFYLVTLWESWGLIGVTSLVAAVLAAFRLSARREADQRAVAILVLATLVVMSAMAFRSLRYTAYVVPMLSVVLAVTLTTRVRGRLLLPVVALLTSVSWFQLPEIYAAKYHDADPDGVWISRDFGRQLRPGELPVLFEPSLHEEWVLYYGELTSRLHAAGPGKELRDAPSGYRGLAHRESWPFVRLQFPDAVKHSARGDYVHWSSPTINHNWREQAESLARELISSTPKNYPAYQDRMKILRSVLAALEQEQ